MDISRKDFLKLSFVFLGGAALLQSGCGTTPSGDCPDNGTKSQINGNHPQPHILAVPGTDLASETAKTYDIMGRADHSHLVTLSPDNLASLANNESVTVTSTTTVAASVGSHNHVCIVSCV